jgi:hypothetical protein
MVQGMLTTTIIGSLRKPPSLAEPGTLFAPWRVPAERLADAQDDAVRLSLADQEAAGIDIVTDGEQRRRHYIWGFLARLIGFDLDRLGRRQSRGGRYAPETDAARLVGDDPAAAGALRDQAGVGRDAGDRGRPDPARAAPRGSRATVSVHRLRPGAEKPRGRSGEAPRPRGWRRHRSPRAAGPERRRPAPRLTSAST